MALTQAQWYEKIRTWVPTWFWIEEENNVAIFQALAKVLAAKHAEAEDLAAQTFLDTSTGGYLDLLGDERSAVRLEGEFDTQFARRIKTQSLVSWANKPALLQLINGFLIKGQASIKEDWEGGIFFDREHFFNRAEVPITDYIENTFTIVVDRQVADPYSYFDREHFMDREDFMGTTESSQYVFDLILAAVDDNKALGVLYRVYERFS